MKSMKRSISVILLAALLASSAAGCGSTPADDGPSGETTSAEDTEPVEVRDPLLDDLGEFDFGGYVFRVLSCTYDPNGTFTLFDTELNGEVLNDSLYTRNREIEDRFNIKFECSEKSWGDCSSTLRSTVTAGDDAYDTIMLINREAFAAALEGYIMPVDKLIYLNPEKPYYLHDINDAMTIAGKSFFYYSEESIYTFERAACLLYNKTIADDFKIPDLYKTVKDGKWTVDQMYTYSRSVAKDINGDSKMDSNDQWGFVGSADDIVASLYNLSGAHTIEKDENDIPYFAAKSNEKIIACIERTVKEMESGDHIWCRQFNQSSRDSAMNFFKNGQALLCGTVIAKLLTLRDMETDFGVLPYPKYDEAQENYVTRVVDAWLHIVPVTNPDPARTSVILEALASGSARYVFPAYYDNVVLQKAVRDDESVEMLELIRSTRTLDLGECPWFQYVRQPISTDVVHTGSKPLVSTLASIETELNEVIANAVERAKQLP